MTQDNIRDIRQGDWYWVNRAVVRDHAKGIGAIGIAVYNVLASMADASQTCYPSQKRIAEILGYSRATVNRTLKLLEDEGLIRNERRGRYFCLYRLISLRCKAEGTQMSAKGNSDVRQVDTSNSHLMKDNNENVRRGFNLPLRDDGACKPTKQKDREENLALELAEGLDDPRGFPLYLAYARTYPEFLLRKTLVEVKETPPGKLTKSRAVLFNYLMKRYAQGTNHNPGHQPRN